MKTLGQYIYQWGLLGLLCIAPWTMALTPEDYYKAQVVVASQQSAERARAAGVGLKEVLVRVSGDGNIAAAEGVLTELTQAARYLELFDYGSVKNADGDSQAVLNMTFAEPLVVKLLERKGLPYWPTNRPNTLVWLVLDDAEQGRHLINDKARPEMSAVMSAAWMRGLPLVVPLLDLEDQLAIEAEQVWSLDEAAILNASARYGAPSVLVGRITQTSSGLWLTTWHYLHRGQSQLYDARGETLEEVAMQGITPLADYMAGLYAVTPNAEGASALVTQMHDIDSYEDYSAMVQYLDNQAIVQRYRVTKIEGSNVVLTLQLSGSLEKMRNALALDGKISTEFLDEFDDTPWRLASVGSDVTPLHLYWRGGR